MKKSFYYFAVLAIAGCTFTSCSDDDDDNSNGGATNPTEFFVPASIVDGTRVQSVGDLSATYNEDGSISKLENNGTTYTFEYANTRAAVSTGRQIKRIYAKLEDTVYECTNFKFNSDGFLTAMTSHSLEQDYYGTEEVNVNYELSYNGEGRLTSNKVTGSVAWKEDGESGSDKVSTTINYNWKNGNLISGKASSNGFSTNVTYNYGQEDNTFNIFTPHMSAAVGIMDDPILATLSMLGFTGNSSAKLPTSFVSSYTDEDGTETDRVTFTYTFNPNHSIDLLYFENEDESNGAFKYTYFKK